MAYDSTYWRDRAEEARTKADQMHSRETKRSMLCIAESYYQMAERAEEMERLKRERLQTQAARGA